MKIASILKANTPMGVFTLYSTQSGLIRVFLPETLNGDMLLNPNSYTVKPDPTCLDIARSASAQLIEYVDNTRQTFDIKLDYTMLSSFSRDIYEAARSIPYGQTQSYSNLANFSGHPGKARAVGGALGRNPFPVIVPCHRIISASGKLGGWSGPKGFKERLIGHEQRTS